MYYLFLLGKFIALIFPRSISYKIAEFISCLQYYLAKKERVAIRYNLDPVLDDKNNIEKYIKNVFVNFTYYLVDFFRYSRIDKDFVKKYVRIDGQEYVDEVKNKNIPIIALSAHLGNYELAGAITSLLGYSVAAVVLPHRDKRENDFFNVQRNRVGISVIPTGHAIKGCISALCEGKVLGLLGDRDFSKHGFKLKMFSRYAYLPRGTAFFAKKTGACIIPTFLVRENKYYYHLCFEKPLYVDNSMDEQEIIKQYIPVLEKYIKKYPDQWYIFEKYWLQDSPQTTVDSP